LEQIASDMEDAWCVMGDFNSVLYAGDTMGGNAIQDYEVKPFADCITTCGLQELQYRRPYYSWTNKIIWSRIERPFVNTLWYDQFDFSQAQYLNNALLDHTPLILHLTDSPKPKGILLFCEISIRDTSFMSLAQAQFPKKI